MGQETKIQWTDRTWNPVRGCSRVSAGCTSCYAERHAARFAAPGLPFAGFVRIHRREETRDVVTRDGAIVQQVRTTAEPRWTGNVELVPSHLGDPLGWRKPARVFVNSMSDLFHERLSNEEIAAVFGVMAACPQHTFQVLTKRPARAREWFRWLGEELCAGDFTAYPWLVIETCARNYLETLPATATGRPWPLPNVWLGVSLEDQATADERIPVLLDIPAALRFVSAEPLLGPVDLAPHLPRSVLVTLDPSPAERVQMTDPETGVDMTPAGFPCTGFLQAKGVDWVIVGGESGPGARPCAMEWLGEVVAQCRTASVPAFVKQLGARPVSTERVDADGRWAWQAGLKDKKGGDPAEWPEDLCVREFPTKRLNHGRLVEGAGRETRKMAGG